LFEIKNKPYKVPNPSFDTLQQKYTRREFKRRTFFITGDWPAVCYAVWNRVNTIMVFKHPTKVEESCILKFSF
jgi:hypothetical protein